MLSLLNSIPQVYEYESLDQVAKKFLEIEGEKLDVVNKEGYVVGEITSRNLLAALAKNIAPNTPVRIVTEDIKEIVERDYYNDIILLENEKFVIAAFEASSDGILISDAKGNVEYVNSAYENTTGLKKEEMISQNLQKLLEKRMFNISASLLVLDGEESVSTLHNYVTGKNALTTASPIYNKKGEIIGVFNNTRNLSTLARLRSELAANNSLILRRSNETQQLLQAQMQYEGIIFKSKTMAQMLHLASKAACFDSNILIYGESGTGKEVLARFIHQQSSRNGGPFVKVNCAAIPAELFESELFGYEPGSFTGANQQGKPGMFELANQGTILLDEVSELPLAAQTKLLRVIQEREVLRLGASKVSEINVRILAATNKDLSKEVKLGNFREDLFFRLNVVPINIPALRERKEDISILVLHFLKKLNKLYKKNTSIAPEVIDIMNNYSWPGNVREIQNLIEYLFVIDSTGEIGIEQLPTKLLADHILEDYNQKAEKSSEKLSYLLEHFEKNIIISTLKNYPSMRKAATDLGINPSTLSRKIKRYGINAF